MKILANDLIETCNKKNIEEYLYAFKEHITNIIFQDVIKNSQIFNQDNINLFYFDEYTLKTNVINDTYASLYVVFDSEKNIKNELTDNKKNKKKSNLLIKEHYIELDYIREKILDSLLNYFDDNTMVWLDKYSIRCAFNVIEDDDTRQNYYFKIIPCFGYKNENNVKGVIYYDKSKLQVEIEYPLFSIENFNEKDIETDGAFLNVVLAFKNIYKKIQKINDYLPFEIFEILMYNVPNNLFNNSIKLSLHKIINYLRNQSLRNFKSLDEQDFAFTSRYKSLSILYAKKVINIVEKYFQEEQ